MQVKAPFQLFLFFVEGSEQMQFKINIKIFMYQEFKKHVAKE